MTNKTDDCLFDFSEIIQLILLSNFIEFIKQKSFNKIITNSTVHPNKFILTQTFIHNNPW